MISLLISLKDRLHCAGIQGGCHGIDMKLYILKTRNNLVLNRNCEWSDEPHRDTVFCTEHRDIALNQLIEVNAKDTDLRVYMVECDSDAKGRPILAADEVVAKNIESNQSNVA